MHEEGIPLVGSGIVICCDSFDFFVVAFDFRTVPFVFFGFLWS